jgi:hypothetical protein
MLALLIEPNSGQPPVFPADPSGHQRALAEALAHALRKVAAAGPLLIVLDDLHWADMPSLRALDAALELLQSSEVMVLGLARPELQRRFPHLFSAAPTLRLTLGRLNADESVALVNCLLPRDPAAAELGRIVQLGEGNPFFLEELVNARASGDETFPDSVLAVVEARLEARDEEERAVLAAASLFGTSFWEGAVRDVMTAEGRSEFASSALTRLVAAQLLITRASSRFPGERELAFRHALLREGALARLCRTDMQRGHLAAARWLERNGEDDPSVLAHHFALGGDREQTGHYSVESARKARNAFDYPLLAALAEQALAMDLPAKHQGNLHEELAHVYAIRGDYERAKVHAGMRASLISGPDMFSLARQMMSIVEHEDVPDLRQATDPFDEIIDCAVEPGTEAMACPALAWPLWELYCMGFGNALRARIAKCGDAIARIASGYPTAVCWRFENLSFVHIGERYELEVAHERLLQNEALAETLGDRIALNITLAALCAAAVERGCPEEAVALGKRTSAALLYASQREVFHYANIEALVALERWDDAEQALSAARAMNPGTTTDRGRLDAAEGLLALARGQHARAELALNVAAHRLGRVPPEHAVVVLRHARLCAQKGELARASALLGEAEARHEWLLAQGYIGKLTGLLAATRAELSGVDGRAENDA